MTIVIPDKPRDLAISSMQVAKCLLASDTAGDTNQYDVIIGSGDSAAVVNLFQFQHNTLVYDVGWRVRAPFTGSMTLTIGDSDAAAGWGSAAQIGDTVADTDIQWAKTLGILQGEGIGSTAVTGDTTAGSVYGIAGRLYVADTVGSPLNLTATVGGAIPTTGQIEVYALYSLMGAQRDAMAT